jgi:hypothetical protein
MEVVNDLLQALHPFLSHGLYLLVFLQFKEEGRRDAQKTVLIHVVSQITKSVYKLCRNRGAVVDSDMA